MINSRILFLLLFLFIFLPTGAPALNAMDGTAYNEISRASSENRDLEDICTDCQPLFSRAFEEVPAGSEAWQKLVYIKATCLGVEKKDKEAIPLLTEALKIEPENYRLLYALGCAYLRENDWDSAETYLTMSNTAQKNPDALYKLAFIHFLNSVQTPSAPRMDLLNQAESEIEKALQGCADSPDRAEISDTMITRANLPQLDLLSNIYQAQGKTGKAVSLRRQLLVATEQKIEWDTPKKRAIMIAEQEQAIGQLLYATGQREEGLEFMTAAVETAPTDALKTHFNLILQSTTGALSQQELETAGFVTGAATPLE